MSPKAVGLVSLLAALLIPYLGVAGRGSVNRIATVSIGKHFDKSAIAEVTAAVDPVLAPLGFARMSEDEQKRTFGYTDNPAAFYKAEGQAFASLMTARGDLDCIAISVTDFTRPPEERIVPVINAIAGSMMKLYGSATKFYSDSQCLHAIPRHS
jgi:hypothetical protein